MSIQKKFFLIFLFIILDTFLVVGYLVVRDATMVNRLKKEVYELSKLDITKDRYNRDLITRGEYAKVEGAIKDYLDSYAVLLQEVLSVMKDPKFTQLLSYANYQADGPLFESSTEYLATLKKDFNSNMDQLLKNLDEDTIKDYIKDKTDNPYYQNLYNDLMFSDSMKDDFTETRKLLEQTKTKVNSIMDCSSEIFNFLKLNKDAWVLEEGEIRFQTEALYNQYNAYILKIKE